MRNERLARHNSATPTYACTKLRRSPQQVGESRRFTRMILAGLLPTEVLADALLIVSELVTRAVGHVGGPVTLCIEVAEQRCTVTVHDAHPEMTEVSCLDREKGEALGMALISALAELRQVTDERGVSVTAELTWRVCKTGEGRNGR